MLHSLKQQKLNDMKELGLKLEDYDIYNPPDGSSIKDAVVQFGGGCTGGGYLLTGACADQSPLRIWPYTAA